MTDEKSRNNDAFAGRGARPGHGAGSDPDPAEPSPTTSGGSGGQGGDGGAGGAGGEEKLPNGAACSAGAECDSNSCADGFCCDGTCTGVCDTCSAAGSEGTCTPHAAATDPESGCQGGSCDGAGQCAIGTLAGCAGFGDGAAVQTVHQVVSDRDRNSILVGSFQGALSFGAAGDELWSRRFGGTGSDRGVSVATDFLRNVTAVGLYQGAPDFGTGPLPDQLSEGIFVARCAP